MTLWSRFDWIGWIVGTVLVSGVLMTLMGWLQPAPDRPPVGRQDIPVTTLDDRAPVCSMAMDGVGDEAYQLWLIDCMAEQGCLGEEVTP